MKYFLNCNEFTYLIKHFFKPQIAVNLMQLILNDHFNLAFSFVFFNRHALTHSKEKNYYYKTKL